MTTGKNREDLGAIALIRFSLLFGGPGVFVLGLAACDLWRTHLARSWRVVPAVIQEVSRVSDGERAAACATYRYEVDGRAYTGTRVSLFAGGDNIDSFQQRASAELTRYQESGQPFPCYVDPAKPTNAVLYRQVRWEMIAFKGVLGLVFTGVGFGLLAFGVSEWRSSRWAKTVRAARPGAPWLMNPAWAGGVIRSDNRIAMIAALVFAVLWNGLSLLPLLHVLQGPGWRPATPLAYFLLIFPAIGVLLAVWAVRMVLRYRTYGTWVFRMAHVPGVIGGAIKGTVEIPAPCDPSACFRVTLRCIGRTSGVDETHECVLWEDVREQARAQESADPLRSQLPVQFAIPCSCQPTTMKAINGGETLWQLDVERSGGGPWYRARFEVPVFVTPNAAQECLCEASHRCRSRR